MNPRHTLLIARYSARYSVRGGVGLVFLLLSLTFGLLVAHLTLQPVEMVVLQVREQAHGKTDEQLTRQVLDQMIDRARPAVSWVLSKSSTGDAAVDATAKASADAWADYLLLDRPALLSAIFLILLFGWPMIASCGAFDLYAGDIASRQLRYQLLRADRASIYFGRLLGTLLTFAIVLLLLGVTVAGYMGAKLPHYGWGPLLGWASYSVCALAIVTLPYVALCAWISTAIGSSFASLTVVSLVIGGLPLFAMFGRMTWPPAEYINYLLPWGFQTRLFHPDASQVALAVLGCLVQTIGYGWLGYRKFTTRDL